MTTTKTNYFADCTTLEELKSRYHELARKYHPDNGGDVETMKEVNAEFDRMHGLLKNTHKKADGTTWTAEAGSKAENKEAPEEFRDMINNLLKHNLTIEIIGCFVWVYGDTKAVKDELKAMGFRWHSKKLSWYLKPEDYKRRSRKEYSMEEIRSMYTVHGVFYGHEDGNAGRTTRPAFQPQRNEYQPAPVL